jgi:hypothetical protein
MLKTTRDTSPLNSYVIPIIKFSALGLKQFRAQSGCTAAGLTRPRGKCATIEYFHRIFNTKRTFCLLLRSKNGFHNTRKLHQLHSKYSRCERSRTPTKTLKFYYEILWQTESLTCIVNSRYTVIAI